MILNLISDNILPFGPTLQRTNSGPKWLKPARNKLISVFVYVVFFPAFIYLNGQDPDAMTSGLVRL